MSDIDSDLNKHLNNDDFDSNSDSSIGIKDFGADVSELSDDNPISSGEEDEDELVKKLEDNVLLKKNDDAPVFVDEFASQDEDMSDNIDDINKHDNKIKIFKQNRSILHNGRFYRKPPRYNFSSKLLKEKIQQSCIKNIAFIGPYKSGKTTLVSNIIVKQHRKHFQRQKYDIENKNKYLDNSLISKYRKTTCRLNMGVFLHNDESAINVIDTPGHSDLWNETYMACDMADFIYIVIDAVEGVTDSTRRLFEMASKTLNKKVGFIINKVDRLILELKLDEVNFYFKILSIVNLINDMGPDGTKYSPELDNIIFASSKLHLMFSIESFLRLTNKQCKNENVLTYLKHRCWGSVIFKNNQFSKMDDSTDEYENLTFVQFIVRPLYKILINGMTYNIKDLKEWVKLNFERELMSSAKSEEINDQLIKLCECIFEADRRNDGFKSQQEILIRNVPENNHDVDDTIKVKAYKSINYDNKIWCLCKVISGKITTSKTLQYDGGSFTIDNMAFMGGRFIRKIENAYPNQIILIKKAFVDGVPNRYPVNQMLYEGDDIVNKFRNKNILSNYMNEPVVKVGLQPKSMKHHDLLNDALQIIQEIYPDVRIEENQISKMYFLHACGEMQLDMILFELRYFYMAYYHRHITDFIEVKSTANLITDFKEGCSAESFASIPASSKYYSISVVATPLEKILFKDISERDFNPSELLKEMKLTELSSNLRKTYKWESSLSRNILAIKNTVFLVNDILPDDMDNSLLERLKAAMIEAFYEICEEGPLAAEHINSTIFKLMSLELLNEENEDDIQDFKNTFKKACKIALLSAKPVLYEPYFEFSVISRTEYSRNMEYVFNKRRGCEVTCYKEISGSKLIEITGKIPCIDSVGLNVDLLLVSNGSCIYQTNTTKRIWHKVEGNVMDNSIQLHKLEPAKDAALSRDFLMKTRKRKDIESNISSMDDKGPSLQEYIDDDLFLQLKELSLI
ncbi:uncharacterized protein HGUI_02679 [Hanseniaspora guilliermondii]|uniref:Tr-type G domain-containing protein n=1 Tax=Hanseniaspora guilliermondii TaxID=56406 RepID=A0A1L0D049_9ASCO|nr:uncharacterized protein HGUI_02679 [Hanseniaspora guilliermondii]